MNSVEKIAAWVRKKPIILIRLNGELSDSLYKSQHGFEHLTIAKPHAAFQGYKLPTICLLEAQSRDEIQFYLATATRKVAISTFDSRLSIKKLRIVNLASFRDVMEEISTPRMLRLLEDRIPPKGEFSLLSSELSAQVIEILAGDPDNHAALEVALALLPGLRPVSNLNWARDDAIRVAMTAFGLRATSSSEGDRLKQDNSSGVSLAETHLYEDNLVHSDASNIPGFEAIASDITGRAVFQRGDERLIIYTANKLPLERMLGVDLIYINESRGSVVMIQYKMLEPHKTKDWIFRPDQQFQNQINRMRIPKFDGIVTDYRMNRNPFFFKFVKRKVVDDSHQSFLVSLDHLNQILADPKAKGAKEGIRLSYASLNGTYLRETDMIGLIRSGYIGTHRAETEALARIIDEAAKGNKAIVLAWQQKVKTEAGA